MAVGHILFNWQLPHAQQLRAFFQSLDSVIAEGNDILAIMAQMKDSGSVGQYLADQYGFGLNPGTAVGTSGDTTVAANGVAEFESLMAKLNTTGSTTDTPGADYTNRTDHVADAVKQAVAKFG